MVELHMELGIEIHLKPLNPEEDLDCAECMKLAPEYYKTVYTRKLNT
jgi:hypothetical protein